MVYGYNAYAGATLVAWNELVKDAGISVSGLAGSQQLWRIVVGLIGRPEGGLALRQFALDQADALPDGGGAFRDGRRLHVQPRLLGFGGEQADKVSTSAPSSLTSTVCSHCADRLRSLVTMVQPSGSSEMAALPALIIGSMVKIMPGSIFGPVPALP